MQVRFEPTADRVLWQLRTHGGELFEVWLTRRLLRQVWPLLQGLVGQAGLKRMSANATVLPEARAMLAQAARERPLPMADFSQPFNTQPATKPLGPEPLLPEAVELGPGANGQGLKLQLRDAAGRNLALGLSDDLATGLARLLEQALIAADWGITAAPATPEALTPAGPPTLLS